MAMTEMLHRACGGVAFLYDDPRPGERLMAKRAQAVDGSPMSPLTPIVCGSCGAHVDTGDLERGRSAGESCGCRCHRQRGFESWAKHDCCPDWGVAFSYEVGPTSGDKSAAPRKPRSEGP